MKKVVLITGASSGIGLESALLLNKLGYTVYGAARRIERMQTLTDLGISVIAMDVTNNESMAKGVNEILAKEKRIDVLINNAGYGSYGALEDVDISEAKAQFEVNIFGLARLTQLVLPHMRQQKSGRIINISSIGGEFGEPHGAWYHATKFALEGLSDSLRMELKQFGIEVVLIRPGVIDTEWNSLARENLLKASGKSAYKALAEKHANLLKRAGEKGSKPVTIAKTIAKAVSANKPKTRYTAGKGAKLILCLKNLLSDKMFDTVMLGSMR